MTFVRTEWVLGLRFNDLDTILRICLCPVLMLHHVSSLIPSILRVEAPPFNTVYSEPIQAYLYCSFLTTELLCATLQLIKERADLVLVEMLENHGWDCNVLYSFKLFGRILTE